MKPVTNYLKNVTKSITYAAMDVAKEDLMPNIGDFIDSNKEFIAATYATLKNPAIAIRKSVDAVQKSKVYQALDYGARNLFEDLRTGNFYNKERNDRDAGKLAGLDADNYNDLSEFGIDDDWESLLNGNGTGDKKKSSVKSEVTTGDTLVADTIEGTTAASTSAIINGMISTSEMQTKNARANTSMLYMQNQRLLGGLHKDLSAVNATLASMHKVTSQAYESIDKNTASFFSEELKLSTERNAILKEMLEMQRAQYKSAMDKEKQANSKTKKKMRWSDINSNGMPDFSSYFEVIKQNVNREISSLGIPGFGEDSNMLAAMMTSPLQGLTKSLVGGLVPAVAKAASQELDKSISGIFGNVIARLGNARGEQSIPGMLAKIFGVRTSADRSINTSKYEKGPVPFDGITRKAIIDVIPTYLRRIEAYISGRPEQMYDYTAGRWTTANDVKKRYDDIHENAIRSGSRNIKQYTKTIFDIIGATDKHDAELIEKAKEEFDLFLYNNNGIFHPEWSADKNGIGIAEYPNLRRYYDVIKVAYKKVLEGGKAVDHRTSLKVDPDKKTGKFQRLGKFSLGINLAGDVLSAKDQEERMYRQLEETFGPIQQYMSALSGALGIDGHGKWNKDTNKFTIKDSILFTKDKNGKDIFTYLSDINKELIWQRKFGFEEISRGYIGGSSGNNNQPSNDNPTPSNNSNYRSRSDSFFNSINMEAESSISERRRSEERKNSEHERAKQKILKRIKEGKGLDVSLFDDEKSADFAKYIIQMVEDEMSDRITEEFNGFVNADEVSTFFNDKFIKNNYKSVREIREAAKKAKEESKDKDEDRLDEKEKSFLKSLIGKMSEAGSISGGLIAASGDAFANLMYTADRAIYEMMYKAELKDDEDASETYDGFMDMISHKINKTFENTQKRLRDEVIDPIKKWLGIDENSKDRFLDELTKIGANFFEDFKNANKGLWEPVVNQTLTNIGLRDGETTAQKKRKEGRQNAASDLEKIRAITVITDPELLKICNTYDLNPFSYNGDLDKLIKDLEKAARKRMLENTKNLTEVDNKQQIREASGGGELEVIKRIARDTGIHLPSGDNVSEEDIRKAFSDSVIRLKTLTPGFESSVNKYGRTVYSKEQKKVRTKGITQSYEQVFGVDSDGDEVPILDANGNNVYRQVKSTTKQISDDANLNSFKRVQHGSISSKLAQIQRKYGISLSNDVNSLYEFLVSTDSKYASGREKKKLLTNGELDKRKIVDKIFSNLYTIERNTPDEEKDKSYSSYTSRRERAEAFAKYKKSGNKNDNTIIDFIKNKYNFDFGYHDDSTLDMTPEERKNLVLQVNPNFKGDFDQLTPQDYALAFLRGVDRNFAKGTIGKPFMGNTMLSKGELLFNSDGISRVKKTDAYRIDKPTHILSSPQSYDLLKASGYPQNKLGVRSTVQQDLGRENLRKKAIISNLPNHDEGTVQISNNGRSTGVKGALTEAKTWLPEGAAGGLVGILATLLTGLPVGLGAIGGATASIVSHSDTFKEALFGKIDEGTGKRDGSGIVSKSIVDFAQKNFPTMFKYGLAGIIPGMLIPGIGILPGLLAGAGVGFFKSSDEARRGLFGDGLKIGDQQKDILNKLLPAGLKGAGIGAAAGLITVGGPFGIAGGAILGSALGMANTTEEFKTAIFGNGDDEEGLLGAVGEAFQPLKDAANDLKDSIKQSVQQNIIQPLNDFINPFVKQIPHMLSIIPEYVNKFLDSQIGLTLKNIVKNTIGRPVGAIVKAGSKLAGGAFKVATSPLRLLGAAGRRMRAGQIMDMRADDMTASERINFMNTKLNPITQRRMLKQYQSGAQQLDTFLADIGTENGMKLQDAKDLMANLDTIGDTKKGLAGHMKSNEKEIRAALLNIGGGKVPRKAVNEAMKAVRSGSPEKVTKILSKYATGRGQGGLTSAELTDALGAATTGSGKSLKELLTENKSIHERTNKFNNRTDEDIAKSERAAKEVFSKLGIDFDPNDKKQLRKIQKLLNTEITNIEADSDRGETRDEQLSKDVSSINDIIKQIAEKGIKIATGDEDNKIITTEKDENGNEVTVEKTAAEVAVSTASGKAISKVKKHENKNAEKIKGFDPSKYSEETVATLTRRTNRKGILGKDKVGNGKNDDAIAFEKYRKFLTDDEIEAAKGHITRIGEFKKLSGAQFSTENNEYVEIIKKINNLSTVAYNMLTSVFSERSVRDYCKNAPLTIEDIEIASTAWGRTIRELDNRCRILVSNDLHYADKGSLAKVLEEDMSYYQDKSRDSIGSAIVSALQGGVEGLKNFTSSSIKGAGLLAGAGIKGARRAASGVGEAVSAGTDAIASSLDNAYGTLNGIDTRNTEKINSIMDNIDGSMNIENNAIGSLLLSANAAILKGAVSAVKWAGKKVVGGVKKGAEAIKAKHDEKVAKRQQEKAEAAAEASEAETPRDEVVHAQVGEDSSQMIQFARNSSGEMEPNTKEPLTNKIMKGLDKAREAKNKMYENIGKLKDKFDTYTQGDQPKNKLNIWKALIVGGLLWKAGVPQALFKNLIKPLWTNHAWPFIKDKAWPAIKGVVKSAVEGIGDMLKTGYKWVTETAFPSIKKWWVGDGTTENPGFGKTFKDTASLIINGDGTNEHPGLKTPLIKVAKIAWMGEDGNGGIWGTIKKGWTDYLAPWLSEKWTNVIQPWIVDEFIPAMAAGIKMVFSGASKKIDEQGKKNLSNETYNTALNNTINSMRARGASDEEIAQVTSDYIDAITYKDGSKGQILSAASNSTKSSLGENLALLGTAGAAGAIGGTAIAPGIGTLIGGTGGVIIEGGNILLDEVLNAKGTMGKPFMGNTMLSKGELLFNANGVTRVPETGAYTINTPTHILSSPQSYDLLKASGYPQNKLGVRSTVQQDLGKEKLKKRALLNNIAYHAEGTSVRDNVKDTVSDNVKDVIVDNTKEKVSNKLSKNVISTGTTGALRVILETLQDGVDKLFNNSRVLNKLYDLANTIDNTAAKKWVQAFKDKIINLFRNNINNASGHVAQEIFEDTAARFNILLDIAQVITDFFIGYDQAESYLGVSKASKYEEVIAGLTNALCNLLVIPSIWPGEGAIATSIAELFDWNLIIRQNKTTKEYENYVESTGNTDWSKEEYLKRTYSWSGKYGGAFKDTIKRYAKSYKDNYLDPFVMEYFVENAKGTIPNVNLNSPENITTQLVDTSANAIATRIPDISSFVTDVQTNSIKILDLVKSGNAKGLMKFTLFDSDTSGTMAKIGSVIGNSLKVVLAGPTLFAKSFLTVADEFDNVTKSISELSTDTVTHDIISQAKEGDISIFDKEYWETDYSMASDTSIGGLFKRVQSSISRVAYAPVLFMRHFMENMLDNIDDVKSMFTGEDDNEIASSESTSAVVNEENKDTESETYMGSRDPGTSKYINYDGTTITTQKKGTENVRNKTVTVSSGQQQTTARKKAWYQRVFGKGTGSRYGMGYSKQNDPSIAKIRFNASGDSSYQTIGDSGCGPAAAVNAVEAMYGRGSSDIVDAADYAIKGGYKEHNGGTYPKFFNDYFSKKGYDSQTTSSKSQLMRNIKAGHPTVLMGSDSNGSSSNTPYGRNPHYVTATGIDRNGHVIIQDPESKYDNQLYSMSDVMKKTSFGVSAFGKGVNLKRFGINKNSNRRFGLGRFGRSKFGMGRKEIIFMGDFRFSEMQQVTSTEDNKDEIWITEDHGDLEWMVTEGIPNVLDKLDGNTALCINIGINDINDETIDTVIQLYTDYFKENIDKWVATGSEIYFVSINPVGSTAGGKLTTSDNYKDKIHNKTIQEFNKAISEIDPIKLKYLNVYDAIIKKYKSEDHLRYDEDTYKQIYELIVDGVEHIGKIPGVSDTASSDSSKSSSSSSSSSSKSSSSSSKSSSSSSSSSFSPSSSSFSSSSSSFSQSSSSSSSSFSPSSSSSSSSSSKSSSSSSSSSSSKSSSSSSSSSSSKSSSSSSFKSSPSSSSSKSSSSSSFKSSSSGYKYSPTGYTEDDYEYFHPGPPGTTDTPLMWRNKITGLTGPVDEFGNRVVDETYSKPLESSGNAWVSGVRDIGGYIGNVFKGIGNYFGEHNPYTFFHKFRNNETIINLFKSDEELESEWLKRNYYTRYENADGTVIYYDNLSKKFVDRPDMSKDRFLVRATYGIKSWSEGVRDIKGSIKKDLDNAWQWLLSPWEQFGTWLGRNGSPKTLTKDKKTNNFLGTDVVGQDTPTPADPNYDSLGNKISRKVNNIGEWYLNKWEQFGSLLGKETPRVPKQNDDSNGLIDHPNPNAIPIDLPGSPIINTPKSWYKYKNGNNLWDKTSSFRNKVSNIWNNAVNWVKDDASVLKQEWDNIITNPAISLGDFLGRWLSSNSSRVKQNNEIIRQIYERGVQSGEIARYNADVPNTNISITVQNPKLLDNSETKANTGAITNSYRINGKVDNTKFLNVIKETLVSKWNSLSNLNNENGNKKPTISVSDNKKANSSSKPTAKKSTNGFTGFTLELAKKFGWIKDDSIKEATIEQSAAANDSSNTDSWTSITNPYNYYPTTVGYDESNIIGNSNTWTNVGYNTQYSNWIAPVTNTEFVKTGTTHTGSTTQIVKTSAGNEYAMQPTGEYNIPTITDGRIVYKKAGKGTGEYKPLAKYGMGPGEVANAARFALKRGYKERNGGTRPGFFRDYFAKRGMGSQTTVSKSQLIKNIKAGHPTVLMGSDSRGTSRNNPYGRNPHYVTATGIDRKGHVIIQDPESRYNNQLYSMGDVMKKTSFGVSAFGRGTGELRRLGCGKGCKLPACGKYGRSKFGRGTDRIIFVGDSRFCQMYNYKFGGSGGEYVNVKDDNGDIWSCKVGEALSWMKSTGIPAIEDELKSGTALCINMGINNGIQGQAKAIAIQYADYFNANLDKWTSKGAKVYFVSVNPVGQGGGADNYDSIYNSDVKAFNKYVMEYCDNKIKYIDTFSAIYDHFETAEGLHYEKSTSDEIYNLICEGVERGGTSLSTTSSGDGGSSNIDNRRSARVLRFNAIYQDADKSIAKKLSDYLVEHVSYDDPETYVGNYTPSGSSSSDSKSSSKKSTKDKSSDDEKSSDTGTGSRFGRGLNEPKYQSKYGRSISTFEAKKSDPGRTIASDISSVLSGSKSAATIADSSSAYSKISSYSPSSKSSNKSTSTGKKTSSKKKSNRNITVPRIGPHDSLYNTDKSNASYSTMRYFNELNTSVVDNGGNTIYGDGAPLQTSPTFHMDIINGKYQRCLRRPKNPYRKGSISYNELKKLINRALSVRNKNSTGSVKEYDNLMLKAYNYIMENNNDRTDIPKVTSSTYGMSVTHENGKIIYDSSDTLTASHISYARITFNGKKQTALRPPRNIYKQDTEEYRELQRLINVAIETKNKTNSVSKYEEKMMLAYEYVWAHNNPDLFNNDYKSTADYKDFILNHPYNKPNEEETDEEDEDDTTSSSSSSSDSSSSGSSGSGDTIGSFLANTIADSKVGQVVNSFINFNASSSSDDGGGDSSSSDSSGSLISGNSTQAKVWNYFIGKGYSKAATSGIMGNIEKEVWDSGEEEFPEGDGVTVRKTGWKYDYNGTGQSTFANDAGGSGLIMWTPVTAQLVPYAKKKTGNEEDWKKLDVQLGCIDEEDMPLIYRDTDVATREEFMKLSDPGKAAETFTIGVERPNMSVAHIPERKAAAQWFYDNMESISGKKSSKNSKDKDDDDSKSSDSKSKSSSSGTGIGYSLFGKPSGMGTYGMGDTTNSMVWWYLRKMGLNEKGAAGVMGNMQAESGINPINLQDSYESSLGYTDESYTKAVDRGTYKNFASDSAGYGLVQFTSSNLKQDLYDHVKEKDKSVGSLSGQLETLNKQLTNSYSDLLSTLKNAKSVSEASNAFLHNYERPADQSSSVEAARASLGEKFYEQFKGTKGTEIDDAKVDFGSSSSDGDSDSSSSSSSESGDTIGSFLSNVLADSKVGQVMNSFINFNPGSASSGSSGGSSGSDKYTGSGSGSDIVKVAMQEYKEGNEGNANKYNAWMWGDGSTLPWCAAFVAWCADQAGISTDVIPKVGECNTMSNGILSNGGKEIDNAKDAKPGDILFYGGKGGYYHVGIVRDFKDGKLRSVEGNTTWANGQWGQVDIHDDVQQTGIGINRPAYATSSKKKNSSKDDEDTDSKPSSNADDDSTSDTGTGALFGMGTLDTDQSSYYEDKPIAKYGTFKESIYGTGSGVLRSPHPHLANIKKTIHDRDGSTRKVVYSGMDREIARAYKSASRPHTYTKYGTGTVPEDRSALLGYLSNHANTKVVDNSYLINTIIKILYTIADNTDKLNTIVAILNEKLSIDITSDDIANNSGNETLKSKLYSSLNNLASTATSKMNSYADTVGDSSLNTIIEAMNMIAAE